MGIVWIRSAVPSVLVRTSLCWLGLDQPGPKPQVASDLCYAWARASKLTSSHQSLTEALFVTTFRLR